MLFSLFFGISTFSGYLELDSLGFLFISLVQNIDGMVVGLIGRSVVLS